MKNRDRWITIAFLVFILVIPLVTVVRDLLSSREEHTLTDEEQAVLEQNGTITNNTAVNGAQDKAEQDAASKETGFARLQKSINHFTDGLFGRTELDGHPIWDYMGINHFTEEEMAAIAANLAATREHLAARNIEFYTMCIPNKEIIYAENMPDTIARVNEVSRGEQLSNYLNENTDLVFVYPKEALMANKDKAQLYYITDSHSNQIGAFVNMQEFFRTVYGTHAEMDSVRFRTDATDYSGDLVMMAGLSDKYKLDTVYVFEPDSADEAQYHDQVLLYVGDSFGGFLSQICKGYYKEVYWEDARDFQYSMLDRYEPDVVIWERAERYCEVFREPILIK